MHLQFCLNDTTWCRIKKNAINIHLNSFLHGQDYCPHLNPSLKYVRLLRHSRTYIRKKEKSVVRILLFPINLFQHKEIGSLPSGTWFVLTSSLDGHNQWRDSSAAELLGQNWLCNLWKEKTEQCICDRSNWGTDPLHSSFFGESHCTKAHFLWKFTLLINQ